MTATWKSKLIPRYAERIEALEGRGYAFDLQDSGSDRTMTVSRDGEEVGSVSGILLAYVVAEALWMARGEWRGDGK